MSFNNQAQTLIEALSPTTITADKTGNKDFPKFAYRLLFARWYIPWTLLWQKYASYLDTPIYLKVRRKKNEWEVSVNGRYEVYAK